MVGRITLCPPPPLLVHTPTMFSNVLGIRGGGMHRDVRNDIHRKHSTVHVLSTNGRRELFGMHRPDAQGEYSTFVLGFKKRDHAEALARGLDTYYARHGSFPPRDLAVGDLELHVEEEEAAAPRRVSVDAMTVWELLRRLSGSGVHNVSVLVDVGPPEAQWWDLQPDAHRLAVLRALDSNFSMDIDEPDQPRLLPKPTRPDAIPDAIPDDVNTGTSRLLGMAAMLYLVSMEALAVWAHFIVCSAGSPLCLMR